MSLAIVSNSLKLTLLSISKDKSLFTEGNLETSEYFIARDHIGIVPLYIGWDKDGLTYVASEMKAIESYCETLQEFPPGHYYKARPVGSLAAARRPYLPAIGSGYRIDGPLGGSPWLTVTM